MTSVRVIFAILLSSLPAFAHDAKHPELDRWYGTLKNPKSKSVTVLDLGCCSKQDCHVTEAAQKNGRWVARVGEIRNGEWVLQEWLPVPAEAVLKVENPTGEAVVCHSKKASYQPIPEIWCFVPPPEF